MGSSLYMEVKGSPRYFFFKFPPPRARAPCPPPAGGWDGVGGGSAPRRVKAPFPHVEFAEARAPGQGRGRGLVRLAPWRAKPCRGETSDSTPSTSGGLGVGGSRQLQITCGELHAQAPPQAFAPPHALKGAGCCVFLFP